MTAEIAQPPVVAVTEPIHVAGLALLEASGPTHRLWLLDDAQREAALADADGLVVRTVPVGRDLLDRMPRLRAIAKHGVGVDNVDVAAATARRIIVTSTPWANSQSVAEHSVALMLALSKRLREADQRVRESDYAWRFRASTSELAGKTLGLVGCGRIGGLVARACAAAFQMRVVVYDPYLSDEGLAALGAERAESPLDLAARSDVVSLHAPLTPHTRALVDSAFLAAMRPGALLVNCARGELVDQPALVAALERGAIAGAGLDVFAQEPPDPADPLLALPNVLLSPHMAGGSAESLERMAVTAAQEVLAVLRGDAPRYPINLPFPPPG